MINIKRELILFLIYQSQTLITSKITKHTNQITITIKSNPEIINISSDSSSDESFDSTSLLPYVPPFRPPRDGFRTKDQARKRKHDLHVFKDLLNLSQTPSTSRGKSVMTHKSSDEEETEDLAKKRDIGMSSKAPMSTASS